MKHTNEAESINEIKYRNSIEYLKFLLKQESMNLDEFADAESYLAQLYGVIFRIA